MLGHGVVDFLKGDVERLRSRLATAERMKLDQHLSSLDELDKQFQALDPSGAVCNLPGAPNASSFPKLKQYNGGEPYFDAITDAHIDVLAQALACDLTRVLTLQWTHAESNQTFPALGISEFHHVMSHAGDTDASAQALLTEVDLHLVAR